MVIVWQHILAHNMCCPWVDAAHVLNTSCVESEGGLTEARRAGLKLLHSCGFVSFLPSETARWHYSVSAQDISLFPLIAKTLLAVFEENLQHCSVI